MFILTLFRLGAQEQTFRYPCRYTQFTNAATLLNPANAGYLGNYELSFGSQSMFGPVRNVSATYFTMHMRLLHAKKSAPFSMIGGIFYNDNEGKYLRRNRFYVSYAWHASINPKWFFSAGFYVGGMNYIVKGTPLTGDGSDIKVDGAAGISFYTGTFHSDVSVGQLFNSKLQPLEEIIVLAPIMNFSARKTFNSGRTISFTPSFSGMIPLFNNPGDRLFADINLAVTYKELFFVSAGFHNNYMLAVSTGISNLNSFKGKLGMAISYTVPAFRKSSLATNYGEIGINYWF